MKVTSKLQVTVPKKIAEQFHIRPGDSIDWIAAGETIRVVLSDEKPARDDREARLRRFDQATERQRRRTSSGAATGTPRVFLPQRPSGRGWTREDLYDRGRTD